MLPAHRNRRPGLATLEMVLALPILLFVAGVMINYGSLACWKVRELTVERHKLWGSRWPRTGDTNPRPAYWPAASPTDDETAGNVPELDDPRVHQPVVRGPLQGATIRQYVFDPDPGVPQDLLDPARGLRQESLDFQRDYPVLGKLGPYHLLAEMRMLDDKWQYQRMWLSSTDQRRIPALYDLAKAPAGLSAAYIQAVKSLLNFPLQTQLNPLDNDDEFIRYEGGAPDFHPGLGEFDALDPIKTEAAVQNLVDRIQGKTVKDAEGRVVEHIPSLPEEMARAFIGLYENVIQRDKAMLKTPGAPTAMLQMEISQLQTKVQALNQFLNLLRTQDGG